MNFKNSKKVIIAAAISTSVLFASNQAYASEAPDENSKEILDAVKDDSLDEAIKETIKEIDQLETTQQAPQSDTTDEQNLEEQTEDEEENPSANKKDLEDITIDKGGEIPLTVTSDVEFGNLASVDDLDPVNDLAPVEDDLDGSEPLGEDSEPVNGNTGANPIEDDLEDIDPIPEEDIDGEETETEELPVDEEEPPIPNEDPDPIDETTENLSGKTTIELETELIGIDNQKIDIESLPEEVDLEFTYGDKTQTKTIKREELYGLVELTNFDFKDEEDLKQKLRGRLDIGDGEKLDLTFTYDPNAIKQDENNKTIARVPLKIHQLFNPNLEVEFKDPDGKPYENKDEIPIIIKWGENGSEYTSTLITSPGVDEDKFSSGSGLVFDDDKYVEERSKTPTIIVRDKEAGDQVLTPDTESFKYNGKTYNIKGINIDPINGAKITPSAIANGEREIDGGRRVEEILFEIERSENENLPEGEVKIIQEGKKGKKVYQKYQPTLDGYDYGSAIEKEIESEYVAPTNEKYQVGTGKLETSESSKEVEIPYNTITIEDEYLPSTYREVEREGKKGSKTVTTTSQTLNDNPYGEVVVTEKINILPEDEIVRVGTATADQIATDTKTYETDIAYTTKIEENPNLEAGKRNTKQRGVNGKKVTTVTQTLINGKAYGEATVEEKVTQNPTEEIIEVGTKKIDSVTTSYEEEIPYKTITRENPDLEAGTSQTAQEGKTGRRKVTITQDVVNGKPNGEAKVTYEEITPAVEEIIEVGTKKVDSVTTSYEEDIPYTTITRENPNLEAGKSQTAQEGKVGRRKVTITQDVVNGKPNGEAKVTYEELTPAVEEIIEIGTRVDDINTSYVYQVTQPIPFETKYENDSSLPAGEERISQEGKDGLETITYEQELLNGKAPENTPATVKNIETTLEPVTQIIKKGTGVVDKTVTEKTESISFKTQYIDDPNLPTGEDIVIREGEVGSKTITTTQLTLNGENYGEASVVENITKAPIDKIVRRGTATAENITNDIKTFTEEIPYQTVEKNNSNLPDGVREISQEGKNGKKVTTITQQIVNGKPYGEAKTNIDITEAKDEIIQVGTGGQIENVTTTETQSIEYKTEFIDDPSLPADEEIEIRQGINGEKTITRVQPTFKGNNYGEATVTEEITTPAQNRIVRRGTATADQITTDTKTFEEAIAYEIESRENPYLPKGMQNIIQEGKNGKKTITITQKLVNGKVYGKANVTESRDEEPISQIIEIGTASVEESIEETPYTTKIIYDETKPVGYREVEKPGVEGRRKVVTITPGPEAGNPTPLVSYENLEEAREEVIRIGTANLVSQIYDVDEVTIDYKTEYRTNPYLPEGEERVIQEGKNGTKVIGYVQKLENDYPVGEKIKLDEIEKEAPQTKIIERGTATVKESTEEIPYTTKTIYDDSKPIGFKQKEVDGKNGIRKVVTIIPGPKATNPTPLVTYETLEEATEEVIRVGIGKLSTEITYEVEELVPFTTREVANPYLPEGEKRVIQEGRNGTEIVTYKQALEDGKAVGEREEVGRNPGTSTQEKVVERGTATVSEKEEKVPYTTRIIYDETKPVGYREVETAGVEGIRKVVTITPGPEAGNPTPLVTYETLEEAREEVVVIGTKKPDSQPPKETVIEIRYEDIDFKIDYIEDPNRYVGDDKLIQKGQKGKRKITTTTVTVDGKTTEDTNIEDIEKVIDEKWLVGTKKIDPEIQPELPELNYEELPIEVEYIFDDSLDEGVEVVIQEGQSAVYAIDENGEQILPALREGKVRIIKKGRKKPQEEIKYYNEAIKTKYIDTEFLPFGKEVLVSEGQVGRYYINDNGEKIYDIQPMDRVIIRGIGKKDGGENNKPINPPTNNNKPNYPIYPPSDDEQITPPSKPNEDSKPIPDTNDSSNIDLNPDENQMDIDPAYVDELIDILNNPFRNWKNDDNSSNPIDKTPSENVDAENKDISDVDANPNKHRKTNESKVDEHDVNPERLRPTKPSKEDSEIEEARVKSSQAIKNDNPQTGIDGSLEILALLAAASSGYFASKKKESNEE